jgi:hypothetical protein
MKRVKRYILRGFCVLGVLITLASIFHVVYSQYRQDSLDKRAWEKVQKTYGSVLINIDCDLYNVVKSCDVRISGFRRDGLNWGNNLSYWFTYSVCDRETDKSLYGGTCTVRFKLVDHRLEIDNQGFYHNRSWFRDFYESNVYQMNYEVFNNKKAEFTSYTYDENGVFDEYGNIVNSGTITSQIVCQLLTYDSDITVSPDSETITIPVIVTPKVQR